MKKKNPLTSTRKVTELLVESLTLRYNPMGNSPRWLGQFRQLCQKDYYRLDIKDAIFKLIIII